MQQVKQSTATSAQRRIPLWALDDTDGKTAETGLTFANSELRVSKNGGAEANSIGTFTEIGGGLYYYVADASEVDTFGFVTFRVNRTGVRATVTAVQVVAFDPYDATDLGLSSLANAVPSASDVATAVLTEADGVTTNYTLAAALRVVLSACVGRSTGVGTDTEVYRDVNNTKNVITASIDANKNRTNISIDAS